MPIQFTEQEVEFISTEEGLPSLRYRLVGSAVKDDFVVAAVWEAKTVPYRGKDLAYFLYEDAQHHTKANYLYWHTAGFAGCVLKPMLRTRLNLGKVDYIQLTDMIFGSPSAAGADEAL